MGWFWRNLECVFARIGRRPWLSAMAVCVVCAVAALLMCPPFLHNDDGQIQFLLAGGNGFSFYTNVGLAALVRWLSVMWPEVAWYLVVLRVLAFMSLWVLAGCMMERAFRGGVQGRFFVGSRLMALLFAAYYVFECFSYTQYTQVGILCVLAAVWLAFSCAERGRRRLLFRVGGAVVLWCAGVCLRWDVLVVGLFFIAGFAGALLVLKVDRMSWLRFACVLAVFGVSGGGLRWVQEAAYARVPAWAAAAQLQRDRVAVQDYAGFEACSRLVDEKALGLESYEAEAFGLFAYVPKLDDSAMMARLAAAHRECRAGLWGLEWMAMAGFPPMDIARVAKLWADGERAAFWVPLGCLLLLVGCSCRRGVAVLWPVLGAFAAYVAVLVLLDRSVIRVVNPAVAVAALAVCAWLPDRAGTALVGRGWLRVVVAVLCAVCVAFVCRNYGRVAKKAASGEDRTAALSYCRSRPEVLFLSLCQPGGIGLMPEGVYGFSARYVETTNLLPIGDGWMFYSPAYREELRRRRLGDPYAALVRDDVMLVSMDPKSGVPGFVAKMAGAAAGCDVAFERVAVVAPFVFWKARRVMPPQ